MFVRKDFAEPADATSNAHDNAEDADRHACKEARYHQGEAKSQNNGPSGRCGHFDHNRCPRTLPYFFYGCERCHSFSSATQNVDNSKNNDPHGIHKMPVQGKYVDASRLLWSDATSKPEKEHDAQHDQSSTHVKGMQANQRIVRCSKKVRGNSEAVLVNQAVPFLASAVQKECPKSNRE